MKDKIKIFSGSTIKIIALVTMLIDHTAAGIVRKMLLTNNIPFGLSFEQYKFVYRVMRDIGRIAFPLFIFLLIEGFVHTRNKWKYMLRMFIFALISEIPFDIALTIKEKHGFIGSILETGHQNVFFTMAFGLLTLIIIDKIVKLMQGMQLPIVMICISCVMLVVMLIALLLKIDYSFTGILAIVVAFLFKDYPIVQMLGICTMLCVGGLREIWAFASVIPVLLYNGKRGLNLKYVFYAFYPVHLLAIWGVAALLGLS